MLSFATGIALFALSAYFGLLYKKRYKQRALFYAEMYDFAIYLTEQIAYSKTPLPVIFKSFAAGKESIFRCLINDYCAELIENAPKEYAIKHLGQGETREVIEFLRGLGKTDAENQLRNLSEQKQRIGTKKEITASEEIKRGKLYFKIAVIIGIALLIIVI